MYVSGSHTAAPSGSPINALDVSWTTILAPISPDGRYFYQSLAVSDSLVPPSATQPQEPTLAPHDKALQALAQQLTQAAATPDAAAGLLIAWRPDGRVLATVSQHPQGSAASAFTISLYDTTTGQLIKQLTPSFAGLGAGQPGAEALQWAPDGKQLLLTGSANGAVIIWGPGSLPA